MYLCERKIVKAGEMYYTNKLLDTEGMTGDKEFIISNGAFEGDALDVSGSLPSSGKVTVTSEGKVALVISNGEYCIRKATTESKVKAEKLSDLGGKCELKTETGKPNTVFTTASDGTSIPACITNNTECSVGTKVGVQVNDSKKYDFYVISDNTSENKITLLMSENLGETVACYADANDNSKGPLTALAYLKTQTSGWTNIPETTYNLTDSYNGTPKYNTIENITSRARLLTMTEAEELRCTTSSGSCPTWLYGNLNLDSEPYAYWTSSAYANNSKWTWLVTAAGSAAYGDVDNDGSYGVRPVITISKTVL